MSRWIGRNEVFFVVRKRRPLRRVFSCCCVLVSGRIERNGEKSEGRTEDKRLSAIRRLVMGRTGPKKKKIQPNGGEKSSGRTDRKGEWKLTVA